MFQHNVTNYGQRLMGPIKIKLRITLPLNAYPAQYEFPLGIWLTCMNRQSFRDSKHYFQKTHTAYVSRSLKIKQWKNVSQIVHEPNQCMYHKFRRAH